MARCSGAASCFGINNTDSARYSPFAPAALQEMLQS